MNACLHFSSLNTYIQAGFLSFLKMTKLLPGTCFVVWRFAGIVPRDLMYAGGVGVLTLHWWPHQ